MAKSFGKRGEDGTHCGSRLRLLVGFIVYHLSLTFLLFPSVCFGDGNSWEVCTVNMLADWARNRIGGPRVAMDLVDFLKSRNRCVFVEENILP